MLGLADSDRYYFPRLVRPRILCCFRSPRGLVLHPMLIPGEIVHTDSCAVPLPGQDHFFVAEWTIGSSKRSHLHFVWW